MGAAHARLLLLARLLSPRGTAAVVDLAEEEEEEK